MKRKIFLLAIIIASFCSASAQMRLTSPTAGEKLSSGSITKIKWGGIPVTDSVKLQYRSDISMPWEQIVTTSGSEYSWKVPKIKSDKFQIKAQKLIKENRSWAKIIAGGPKVSFLDLVSQSYGDDIALDTFGNVYTIGHFAGRLKFEDTTFTSNGGFSIYLAKYNKDGKVLWARNIGGGTANSIAIDSSANICVSGSRLGSPYGIGFVGKYTSEGNQIWYKSVPGTDVFTDIAADKLDNIYATGYFYGTPAFGSYTLTSSGSYDAFLAKYKPDGDVEWAYKAGGESEDFGYSLTLSDSGHVYVTGAFSDDAVFGNNIMQSKGGTDIFLMKCQSNGTFAWSRRAGAGADDAGKSIVVDSTGSIYVSGFFADTTNFEDVQLTTPGYTNTFLAKYSSGGGFQWVRQGGSDTEHSGSVGLALDKKGNIYMAGYFGRKAYFGDRVIESNGIYDAFVTKYTSNGDVLWATNGGGGGRDQAMNIVVDRTGREILVTGWLKSEAADFSETILKGQGYSDIFIWKIDTETMFRDVTGEFSVIIPQMSASNIDVGKMTVDSTKDSAFATFIRNIGDIAFRVDSIQIIGPNASIFSFDKNIFPAEIPAKSVLPLTFRFKPVEVGIRSAQIVIYTQTDTLYKEISGEGIEKKINSVGEFSSEEKFSLMPNPAKDFFRLEFDVAAEKISLLDILGREVKSWNGENISSGNNSFDVAGLAAGQYFIAVTSGNKRKIIPLVVE